MSAIDRTDDARRDGRADPADRLWDVWTGCADADVRKVLFGADLGRRIEAAKAAVARERAINESLIALAHGLDDVSGEADECCCTRCRPVGRGRAAAGRP